MMHPFAIHRRTITPLTSLVGREPEMQRVCELLARTGVRMVTITGPGGTGKTRLALEVQRVFSDDCYFVPLDEVESASSIVPAILQALMPRADWQQHSLEHLLHYLQHRETLLILDNFEHVLDGASLLTDLLTACPGLKVLVTSRVLLQVQAEHLCVLAPLVVPDLDSLPDCESLASIPSVALFMQRVSAIKADFVLHEGNARAIAELCVRLDGLPLALELAAPRLKLLSPEALCARLNQRLQLLNGGGPDVPPRQQSLHRLLSWSYDLLTADEQWLFRHLALFPGRCRLEEIEMMCHRLGRSDLCVLDCVTSLLNSSLLQIQENTPGEVFLSMLETTREFALDCLRACDELEAEQVQPVPGTAHEHEHESDGFALLVSPLKKTPLEERAAQHGANSVLAESSKDDANCTRFESLTTREVDVLRLLASGLTNKQIAGELIISARTVNIHVQSVFRKLMVTSRRAAARYALDCHIV